MKWWLSVVVRVLPLCLSLVLGAGPRIAAAQPADPAEGAGDGVAVGAGNADAAAQQRASEHFGRGVELYSDGDIGGALVEFEAAYAEHPSYRLLYNLAQVHAELLDYAAAERQFVRYLKEGGREIDAERRHDVEAELERLRRRIGTVTITTSQPGAAVFIDDRPLGEAPLQNVPVSAGQRRVHVQKAGFEPVTRVVNVIGARAQTVEISLVPTAATLTKADATSERGGGGISATVWAAVTTGVLLVAGAGTAYWAYRTSENYNDALQRPTTRSELDDLANQAENRALAADILFGAAAVSGVITIVLWVSEDGDDDKSASTSAQLRLGLGSVDGTF